MKKLLSVSMSVIFALGMLAGCSHKSPPGDSEKVKELEKRYAEHFEVRGDRVCSLDRDLDFEAWYRESGEAVFWPDIEIPNGKFILSDSYISAVRKFWNDEYRKCIEQYDFDKVDYGTDGDNKEKCAPSLLYVFIEDGASSEKIEDFESLLSDIKEICKKEEKYHTSSDHLQKLHYFVRVFYIDVENGKYRQADDKDITEDISDSELKLSQFPADRDVKRDPRDTVRSNGNAGIYITADSSGENNAKEPTEDTTFVDVSETTTEDTSEENMVLRIDGTQVPVTWDENDSVSELRALAQNGLTIKMSMYGGFEQVGPIGKKITSDDSEMTALTGDIMLYSGDQIVLFYASNSWEYTHLGKMELSDAEIITLLAGGDVTISLSIE